MIHIYKKRSKYKRNIIIKINNGYVKLEVHLVLDIINLY